MKTQKVFLALTCVSIIVGGLNLSAMAQSPKVHEPIAAIATDSAEIRWQPHVEYARVVLTVSTPGDVVLRREFEAGTVPSFKLTDDNGFKLPDGTYVYELRVVPTLTREVKKALAAARKKDSDEAVKQLQKSGQIPAPVVQSGSFTIKDGVVYSGDAEEPKNPGTPGGSGGSVQSQARKSGGEVTANDQVIPDDLIVQGSACVGLDCVNNENFGFDTIRLKENNTRIKFDDTSTAGGFPANDWQLTANDSASGGANKFSIEDITGAKVPFTVTGGAPTDSIFVSSTGRIGLRTATPVLDLQITTGDTPAHRLEQTSASGFTAQTWDIAGNEANFFVRDVTGGSRLPFRIRPGAPTSSIDISASGSVGIGTSSPSERLHVLGVNNTNLILEGGAATHSLVQFKNAGASRGFMGFANLGSTGLAFFNAAGNTINLLVTNTGNIGLGGVTSPASPIQHSNGATLSAGGAWTNASSKALKTNIHSLSSRDALHAVEQMNPVTFQYKVNPTEKHVGFIAEDVPDLVATSDRKGLAAMDIVAVLTKVVQTQQQAISELKEKVDRLEKSRVRKTRFQKRR